jgi:hypothetical protein
MGRRVVLTILLIVSIAISVVLVFGCRDLELKRLVEERVLGPSVGVPAVWDGFNWNEANWQ